MKLHQGKISFMDVIIYIILIYLVIYFLVEYWYVVLIILSIGIILIKTFKYYKKTKPQKVKEEKIRQLLKYFNNYIPKINGLDYETYTNSIKDQWFKQH